VLVGLPQAGASFPAEESLDELRRLAATAGVTVVGELVQQRRHPDPTTLIGKGKVEELRALRQTTEAQVVVFDDPLTPAQQRNLERLLECKVIDRSALILDIFAQHARSTEGKLQVEVAQLQYLLPRLTRQWTHLSRLGGGVGTRGPGETQLEVDRRRLRERLAQLRRRLGDVERTRRLHRQERTLAPCPTVALVGYTNAGKSTLMNRVTAAGVLVQDQLFATLDPTVRRLRLPGGLPALLVDTVGFIHKLPHQLIEAFQSTLEQVGQADVLVHVVDVSHSAWREHVAVVEAVLADIGAGDRPVVFAFNKVDRLEAGATPHLTGRDGERVSARSGTGIEALLVQIGACVERHLTRVDCVLTVQDGEALSLIRRAGRVLTEDYVDGEAHVSALVPSGVAGRLRRFTAKGTAA
jgi:GTP-binding protein HflX